MNFGNVSLLFRQSKVKQPSVSVWTASAGERFVAMAFVRTLTSHQYETDWSNQSVPALAGKKWMFQLNVSIIGLFSVILHTVALPELKLSCLQMQLIEHYPHHCVQTWLSVTVGMLHTFSVTICQDLNNWTCIFGCLKFAFSECWHSPSETDPMTFVSVLLIRTAKQKYWPVNSIQFN